MILEKWPLPNLKSRSNIWRHTLKPFNIRATACRTGHPWPIIFGDSVADGRDGFASNNPEPVEVEADDDIGFTQANEMDNDLKMDYKIMMYR
ncbi:hypothetical protein AAC387_Pa08g0612 [Persea americana]